MAITLLTNVSKASQTTATSSAIDTTGASLIVVHLSWVSASITLSDSKSNTWTALTQQTSNGSSRLYYCASPVSGSGHTFTITGSGNLYFVLSAAAFSGTHATTPFDSENGASTGAFTSGCDAGSVTPSAVGELMVTGYHSEAGSATPPYTITGGGGYTIINQVAMSPGTYYGGAIAYLISTGVSALNPFWNNSSSTVERQAATHASFKQAAAAGLAANPFGGGGAAANPIQGFLL